MTNALSDVVHFHRAAQLHWRKAVLGQISLQCAFYFTSYLWVTSHHTSWATIVILSWTRFYTAASIKPAVPSLSSSVSLPFQATERKTYSYLLVSLPPEMARPSEHRDQQEMVLRQGRCHNSGPTQLLWTETPMNHIFPWCCVSQAAEFLHRVDATGAEHRPAAWEARTCAATAQPHPQEGTHGSSWVGHGGDLSYLCLWQKETNFSDLPALSWPTKRAAITASPEGQEHIFTSLASKLIYTSQERLHRDWWKQWRQKARYRDTWGCTKEVPKEILTSLSKPASRPETSPARRKCVYLSICMWNIHQLSLSKYELFFRKGLFIRQDWHAEIPPST